MSRSWPTSLTCICKRLAESKKFEAAILCVIVFNCVIIGIQAANLPDDIAQTLSIIDNICLGIYVWELAVRLIAAPKCFFKSGWNIFDFIIVVASLVPAILPFPPQAARILRIFRTLRVLLLVSAFEPLRIIVASILKALPSIFWTGFLLVVVCYIYGLAGYYLFSESSPEYFGDFGATLFTLFQLTTLENWADLAREIMAQQPWSAFYFVTFILISAFIIVNVVVGIIVSSLEDAARQAETAKRPNEDSI